MADFNVNVPPPPPGPFVDRKGVLTKNAENYLTIDLSGRINASSQKLQGQTFVDQAASIAVTALVESANAGLYRINWYQQVTKVDSVSMSLTFNAQSVAFGQSITQSGAALTGNTLNTVQGGSVESYADAGSVLSFSLTAALGSGDGKFAIVVVPEFLG